MSSKVPVRKAGNRVRITAQLIDATTRVHLWSDRFEGTLERAKRFDWVSTRSYDRGSVAATRLFLVEPGIARRVFARVVGVEIDEAPVDLPISDFEDVAPTTGSVLRNVGGPRPIAMLAVTRPLANDEVLA